ncbi:MAG: GntR family transcriptional regulator [Actinomycetota bacterium]
MHSIYESATLSRHVRGAFACKQERGRVATGEGSIKRLTTSEAVAQQLRAEIQRSVITSGTSLRQGEVAARFGVSTTPVREAFALLQADGLVRIDAHRGAVVSSPSADDVRESYQIREVLETLAISFAVHNFSLESLTELQRIIAEMRQTKDTERWIELNNKFHLRTYEPAAKPQLLTMIESLRESSAVYIHLYVSLEFPEPAVDDEHQAILDACKKGDARAAKAAVRSHLRHTANSVINFIEKSAGSKK